VVSLEFLLELGYLKDKNCEGEMRERKTNEY
jgi:hypothetical protein